MPVSQIVPSVKTMEIIWTNASKELALKQIGTIKRSQNNSARVKPHKLFTKNNLTKSIFPGNNRTATLKTSVAALNCGSFRRVLNVECLAILWSASIAAMNGYTSAANAIPISTSGAFGMPDVVTAGLSSIPRGGSVEYKMSRARRLASIGFPQ